LVHIGIMRVCLIGLLFFTDFTAFTAAFITSMLFLNFFPLIAVFGIFLSWLNPNPFLLFLNLVFER
jgi:hypothetical protein